MARRSSTFTTYLSVEPAKNVDQSLASLENRANSALNRIARTAAQASAATQRGGGAAGSTAGLAALAAGERAHASALQRTAAAQNVAAAASQRLTGKHLLESNAARAAAASTSQLERSLRLAAVAANVAQGPLGPIAGRLSAAATAVRELSGIRLGFVGAAAGIAAFARFAGAAQDVKSSLRPLYETQVQVNAAFKDTQRIALEARTALQPVVDLYARLTLAGREAGLSAQSTSRLAETAAKAARLSGGTAASQEAALYQFSQGIGSGTLGGDELRSVREGALRLAKAIADGLDVPISKLKQLGKEGKLTPKVIADALEKESARIDAELAKLPPTISSATNELNNAFVGLINGTDEAYGVTRLLAGAMSLLAGNLGLVVRVAGALAVTYASIRAVNLTRDTFQRVEAWNAERKAIAAAAVEAKNKAEEQRRASAASIVALRNERAQIQANLESQRQAAIQANRTARSASQRFNSADFIGQPSDFKGYRDAINAATIATNNFVNSKERLTAITGQLRGQTATLTTSTVAYRTASNAAARATGFFANAARGLWAAINPVGIALAVGINLLIQYATAESAAAGAADRMAESQNNLAKFVDFTTGKLKQQNAALVQNELLTLRGQATKASAAAADLRTGGFTGLRATLQGGTAGAQTGYKPDPALRRIVEGYLKDPRYGAGRAAAELGRLQGGSKADQAVRDQLISQFSGITSLAQEKLQAQAAQRILAGKGTKDDLRRAQGNFTGTDPDLGLADRTAAGDEKVAKGRHSRAKETDAAAKAETALNQAVERGDKRTDILSRYDSQPSAIDRAKKDIRELQELIGKTMGKGEGVYTKAMADADAQRINYGVRQPFRDAIQEQQRGLDISRLRLQGYDLEADALEKALSIQDNIGEVTRTEFEQLVENERQQLKINDALESRQRVYGQILDLANQTRDSFESALVKLQNGDIKGGIGGFVKDAYNNFARIQARQLTEKLFAGADAKLRELITGSKGVDKAADVLAKNVKAHSDSTTKLIAANDNLASATEAVAARMWATIGAGPGGVGTAGSSSAPGGGTGGLNQSSFARSRDLAGIFDDVVAGLGGLLGVGGGIGGGGASGEPEVYTDPVTGENTMILKGGRSRPAPSAKDAYGTMFQQVGAGLDKIFKSGTFFSGIGKGVGKAFQGAGEGMLASGFAKALGVKQSKTGAAIGGAIGSFLPIPGGAFIGGLVGGTIGGLFKKTKSGSATLSVNADGTIGVGSTSGNSASYKKQASALGGGVGDKLSQIADALGGDLGGALSVSIGKRKGKYVVDPSGSGLTKGGGVVKFTEEAEAIAYAIQDAIKDGVITGISAASQKILQSGQDLEKAIVKASAIESIPKRLLQKTDPVRFAVQQLNDEFTKLIGYLKEGGASAEQFADAQKLYDLERADAIKNATNATVEALQAYLDEMKGGSSSPFNKATVYANAADKLSGFRADIAGGKAVDQNDLLTAARNFQDASRALNGSSEAFFSDFNDLFALISRARDNITATTAGGAALPGSPFDTSPITSAVNDNVAATNNQTAILGAKLDGIAAALLGGGGGGSTINLLPGFGVLPGLSVERSAYG